MTSCRKEAGLAAAHVQRLTALSEHFNTSIPTKAKILKLQSPKPSPFMYGVQMALLGEPSGFAKLKRAICSAGPAQPLLGSCLRRRGLRCPRFPLSQHHTVAWPSPHTDGRAGPRQTWRGPQACGTEAGAGCLGKALSDFAVSAGGRGPLACSRWGGALALGELQGAPRGECPRPPRGRTAMASLLSPCLRPLNGLLFFLTFQLH